MKDNFMKKNYLESSFFSMFFGAALEPNGPLKSRKNVVTILGRILEAFLASSFKKISDIVFGGLLARIWPHVGTVLGPSGTEKTSIFIEK